MVNNMLNGLLNKLFGKKETIVLTYANRPCDFAKIRRAIEEGFTAVFNGIIWILTKW